VDYKKRTRVICVLMESQVEEHPGVQSAGSRNVLTGPIGRRRLKKKKDLSRRVFSCGLSRPCARPPWGRQSRKPGKDRKSGTKEKRRLKMGGGKGPRNYPPATSGGNTHCCSAGRGGRSKKGPADLVVSGEDLEAKMEARKTPENTKS